MKNLNNIFGNSYFYLSKIAFWLAAAFGFCGIFYSGVSAVFDWRFLGLSSGQLLSVSYAAALAMLVIGFILSKVGSAVSGASQ